jgi:bla regulator protein blaR1
MIYYILKSGICLGVLLLVYHVFLKNEKLYNFNRFFLLGSLVFSLSVPFISLPVLVAVPQKIDDLNFSYLETENLPELTAFDQSSLEKSEQTGRILVPPVKKNNWTLWVLIIYGTGLIFTFSRFSMQLFGFYKMVRQYAGVKKDGYRIVPLPQETLPFTFFHYLFVNSESYQNHGIEEEILQHELTHIREKHSIDILIVEFLKCVFWFNPIFYFYKKAIQLNHEFLADQAVVSKSSNVSAYQHLLLSKVLGNEFVNQLCSPFNYSVTRLRLIMMRKSTSRPKGLILRVSILPLAIFLILIFSQRNINTNPSFDLIPFSQQEKGFEAYISEALSEESAYVLELEKFDIEGAKQAYDQLSEEEKSRATEFPFLEDDVVEELKKLKNESERVTVKFEYVKPPEKKVITQEVWENWSKTKNLNLKIDDQIADIKAFSKFDPDDFALFEVREIVKGNLFKKPVFSINLTTHTYFQSKFIKERKIIGEISASYSSEEKVVIPYQTLTRMFTTDPQGKIVKFYPENYNSVILEELYNQNFEEQLNSKEKPLIGPGISVIYYHNGEKNAFMVGRIK